MIYHLRRRFIRICTLSFLGVFIVLFAAMSLITTLQTNHALDTLADIITESGGQFPDYDDLYPAPNDAPHGITRESPFTTRYFSVHYDTDGHLRTIDTGAIVDGWVGDNAWTYPVGKVAPEVQRLLEVGERCMWEGLDNARPTKRLGDIGHAVQSLAEAAGYSVVRDYVGHGIGREMHEDPNVPNFGRRRTGLKLLPGMVLAIEPMVNAGTRKVKQCSDGWLVRTRDGKPSVHFEKTVAITEDGPVVLTAEEGHPRPV